MSILKKKDGTDATLEEVLAELNKSIDVKVSASLSDFTTKKLPEFMKAQLDPLNSQFTTINEALGKITASIKVEPPPNPQNQPPSNNPEINLQIRTLTDTVKNQGTTIAQLQTQKKDADERAEKTERQAFIRQSLNGLPFVNDGANKTAFSIVEPFVRRLEDQSLVATINGENFPVEAFVKEYLDKEHAYLFKSSGNMGAGAPNTGGGAQGPRPKVDINDIRVGMKPESRQAAVDAITAAMAAA